MLPVRGQDREWRLSASPVLTPRPEPGLRSRRLARIAACHHIPRVQQRFRSLDRITSQEVKTSGVTGEDSGQDTLTEGSDNQSEIILEDISQSAYRTVEDDTSGPVSFIFPSFDDTENGEDSPKEVFNEPSSFIFPKQEPASAETGTFLFGQEDINSMKGEVSPSNEDTKGEAKVVHCYVASRGQRERETDIYEVPPPPYFSLLSCDI